MKKVVNMISDTNPAIISHFFHKNIFIKFFFYKIFFILHQRKYFYVAKHKIVFDDHVSNFFLHVVEKNIYMISFIVLKYFNMIKQTSMMWKIILSIRYSIKFFFRSMMSKCNAAVQNYAEDSLVVYRNKVPLHGKR